MAFIRMARPMRRDDSSILHFRERIPRDVLDRVRGRTLDIPLADGSVRVRVTPKAEAIKVSLRTRDPSEAKTRQAVVSTYLANVYRALRDTAPLKLTQAQCVALAHDFYRAWADLPVADQLVRAAPDGEDWSELTLDVGEVEPSSAAQRAIEGLQRDWHRWIENGRAKDAVAPFVDRELMRRGLQVDEPSRQAVLAEFVRSLSDALVKQERNAKGDFSPDAIANRFPSPTVLNMPAPSEQGAPPTPSALFTLWRAHPDQRPVTPSTVASYSAVFDRLKAFLVKRHGSEPAAANLKRDAFRAFIDMRSEKDGVSAKTINGVDLGAINSVFNWAVEQDILTSGNPAAGVKRKVRKGEAASASGRKSLNDAEAKAILTAASNYPPRPTREHPKLTAAKRWVPWLLAYTGTRVGEVAQLRKSDVVKFDGHWAVRLTPEAGTIKTKDTWHVPLHPHLIERGFLDFVKGASDGHLFLTPKLPGDRPEAPSPQLRYKGRRGKAAAVAAENEAKKRSLRTQDERGILGPLRTVKNKLAEFARDAGSLALVGNAGDRPKPNHGWRHRFKAQGRRLGIDGTVLDAFSHHAPRSVADDYGNDELYSAMVTALDKIPRYDVK